MKGKSDKLKSPKTRMDEMFIATIETTKLEMGIKSDRLMSKALNQHANFISRIKTGVQSVPATVWDLLHVYSRDNGITDRGPDPDPFENIQDYNIDSDELKRFLDRESDDIEYSNFKRQTNPESHRIKTLTSLSDVQNELLVATEKILLLTSQLADKERTIQILLSQQPKIH